MKMISKKIIDKAKEFAYLQSKKYELPPIFFLELSNEKGQWLAKKLGADRDIVLMGTLLMDCQLGVAAGKGKMPEHTKMSAKKTEELLSKFPKLDGKTKENILHCIKQHHGVDKFYSIEAEICCNADCYRFASVKGFLGGLRFTRDMPLDDLVRLLDAKADEKWNALSLEICKRELKSQYELIKNCLSLYSK